MPFDPTLPASNSEVKSAELRNQFNGLKDLIDALPPETEPAFMTSEAHLFAPGDKAKLDAALQTETEPVFTGSEAALFQPGDKAKLDSAATQTYVDTRSGAYAAGVASLETVRQPSLLHDMLVIARVTILTNQLPCNGIVDALTDANNPPTTIRGRFRVDLSAGYATHGQTLTFVVRKAEYYKLHFSGSGVTATLDAVAEFPINL